MEWLFVINHKEDLAIKIELESWEEMVSKYREKGLDERYAVYHAMVESVDISTGRIMAALKEAGVEDETVLVFVSDQGGFFSNEPLRGGKLTGALYEGGAKVPFFVKTPDTAGHMVMEDRITTMDLFPTFMDYAGVPSGCRPELDGQSLYGLLHGGSYEKRPIFFYRSSNLLNNRTFIFLSHD